MQFTTIQLIALATLVAGYATVAKASDLPQFIGGLCIILGSATGLVFVTLRQQTPNPQSNSKLPAPWSVLAIGFILMLIGLFVFVPAAERLAIEQYLIAESQGYQFEDLEGIDGVGLGIMLVYVLFGLPTSFLIGLMGTGCSKIFRKSGIGRYSLAVALMLSPLISGTYIILHYWLIHS